MAKPISYPEYLRLDKVLDAQNPLSRSANNEIHDEHLFIITHQAYELWFKQVIFDLDSVLGFFSAKVVEDSALLTIQRRLERINMVLELMVSQVPILETMTSMDFLDFRHLLHPASGFQSYQFRELEIKIGLKDASRAQFDNKSYKEFLPHSLAEKITTIENTPNLFDRVQSWLERTPFLSSSQFSFWKEYRTAVENMFKEEDLLVDKNSYLSEEAKSKNKASLKSSKALFDDIFDSVKFEESRISGAWRLTYPAIQAALFIQLYRDEPALNLPYQILQQLLQMDEKLGDWRSAHARMAKRMLGMKPGTGGSSGYQYLKDAADKHKVFDDFYKLTTFFVRSAYRPTLPLALREKLAFNYTKGSDK
jgi:tryptophan 2,3-dioxygenase